MPVTKHYRQYYAGTKTKEQTFFRWDPKSQRPLRIGCCIVRKYYNYIITAFAGTGSPGNTGDNGPATSCTFSSIFALTSDPSGNIYIGDTTNCRVRKISFRITGSSIVQ